MVISVTEFEYRLQNGIHVRWAVAVIFETGRTRR